MELFSSILLILAYLMVGFILAHFYAKYGDKDDYLGALILINLWPIVLIPLLLSQLALYLARRKR